MRKKISAELKAKVAIESIKGLKTISEISSIYQVHPHQVSLWKKQYLESAIQTLPTFLWIKVSCTCVQLLTGICVSFCHGAYPILFVEIF